MARSTVTPYRTAEPDPASPPPVEVPEVERSRLLGLARITVAVAVGARSADALEAALADGPLPERTAAAFVTLTEGGELRGCMGSMDADAPVWASVLDAARWAARGDPRFRGVDRRELAAIEIDVSVLGPLVPLADPGAFRPGIDGVVVTRDRRRGLLLPEVADTVGNGPSAMLEACCRKAGLRPDAWREPETALQVFRTCRFGGPATG